MFFALNFVPYRIKTYLDGHEKTNPPAEPRHGVVPVGTRSRACACGRSLRDGGSRSAAGHPNRRGANTPLPGRYAARRLFHRHTCHAGQCTGLALPRGRRRSQRVGCRTGHLRRGSHQHGQRRGTGARVRADVAARKTVVHRHGQPRNDLVGERMHDVPPHIRP